MQGMDDLVEQGVLTLADHLHDLIVQMLELLPLITPCENRRFCAALRHPHQLVTAVPNPVLLEIYPGV